ncbi:DNA methyltransferase [Arthrobacter bambusae]|uniref:DNA methyltransferase n=1 Tax=Arthrobacter bambusae TaxID=1338426 RepID=UPI0027D8A42C|nr:site-specific DNA-methyltransferase [Arthrobacter bambusae]
MNHAGTNSIHIGDARRILPELIADGHGNSVKLCYLDPPFNTGGATATRGHYRDHRTSDAWAEMMREVMQSVRTLLRDDGSVWLHLDANELSSGLQICEAVFGPQNSVTIITWERTRRPAFLHGQISSVTDYIVVFGKDRRRLAPFTEGVTEPGKRIPLAHRGNPVAQLAFPPGTVRFNCADKTYVAGDHSSPGIDARLLEDVTTGGGRNRTWLRMSLPSRYSAAKLAELIAEGSDFLIPKVPFRPSLIAAGGKPKIISNLWSWQLEPVETNEDAARQQGLLNPTRPFKSAKPEGLIGRIVSVASTPGDIVLDCFAGSGTTAAVADKLGRRWIAVEEQLQTANDYLKPRLAHAVMPGLGEAAEPNIAGLLPDSQPQTA